MNYHLYVGHPDCSPPCLCGACGNPARHHTHYMNGGVVCDMIDGPCACGAWHDGEAEHIERVEWQKQNGMRPK